MDILNSLKSTILATPTLSAVSSYLIYYAYICAGSLLIPSKPVKGHPQPKRGGQLTYSINGFRLTCLTILLILLFGGILPIFSKIQLFSIVNLST
jgi:hypothetical protein